MRAGIGVDRITVWQGDITKLDVDAVVNAVNSRLLGGGGFGRFGCRLRIHRHDSG
jgi:hypothetical protein